MAPIITSQTPRKNPNEPSAVHGPASIPCIRPITHHQPAAARPKSSTTSPRRALAAAKAGASPCDEAAASTGSGGPGEVRVRKARLALVLDAEGADLRAPCLRHRHVGCDRVEDAVERDRMVVLDAERDDVLDLEIDRVVDAYAVADAVVVDLDRGALDAEHLADEWRDARHRPAELPREDLDELVRLLFARVGVDEAT